MPVLTEPGQSRSGSGRDPTRLMREEVSGSSWGWDLKLRVDTVSGGAPNFAGLILRPGWRQFL